ncbi:hypothetical protein BCT65_000420 [Vibrio splendidus]|uniref:hypothetical protein n=1 Tax=Vibrio splendidus TaxID=29497 RepID=UPI0012FFF716|nr:hypothetical protein [Vibrio splendidus]MCC5515547.1 hypothetical protein [Vibrio splendidus]
MKKPRTFTLSHMNARFYCHVSCSGRLIADGLAADGLAAGGFAAVVYVYETNPVRAVF